MPEITIPAYDGGSFSAYIAYPERSPAPAIIMIQEIFGVNGEMRAKCDEMAKAGYIAVCPDLFWRIEPGISLVDSKEEELQRAFELFGEFDVSLGMKDLESTLNHMRSRQDVTGQVGCIGYCLGGKLAYMMATQTDIDASVSYYGVAIETMLDQASDITSPLMLHIAEKDEFVPPEAQKQITTALTDHPHVTIHSYEGVNHAFSRIDGMNYNEKAASLAKSRTMAFLNEVLR